MLCKFRVALVVAATMLCGSVNAEVNYLGAPSITHQVYEENADHARTGIPMNCTGTPYGWMFVPDSENAMTSTVQMMVAMGKSGGYWLHGCIRR